MSAPGHGPDRRQVMLGASVAALPLAFEEAAEAAVSPQRIGPGRGQNIDAGWRFLRGEGAFQAAAVDDASWRLVDLPHDWSVEDIPGPATATKFGPFDKAAVSGTATGFTVGGEGWYRRRLDLSGVPAGSKVEIVFGGVAVVSEVWINGEALGTHVHAYTPFAYDLTPYLAAGGSNVVAVRVRNLGRNSRWYSGSGIYRSVTLDVTPARTRLSRWGVGAWTRSVSNGVAELSVTTRIDEPDASHQLRTVLRGPDGRIAAQTTSAAAGEVSQLLDVRNARLWAPAHPDLYTLETTLLQGGRPIDRSSQRIGLRIVEVDAERGLRINGEHVLLRGGCVHHDNGLLGACAYQDADERRVLLLKARGFNAIRSSHNPASASFLEACDRHGMLLIEEAFDTWYIHKRPEDYATYFEDHWREDLAAMVLSARNHPSVIMWSIGNEVPERSTPKGMETCWRLANEVRRLDPTRPVTAALQEFLGRPVVAAEGSERAGHAGELDQPSTVFLDVAGYNYKLRDIEDDHRSYPRRIIFASETYPHDAYDYVRLAEKAPYFIGEFVWTAMDYIGEAGVGLTVRVPDKSPPFGFINFPIYNAFCGDIDLIGDQKPQSRFRDVAWGISPLEVAVRRPLPPGQTERIPLWGWSDELPSWTWPGAEGKTLMVRMYTSGDRVDLQLDGRSVGSRTLAPADGIRAELEVAYAPGKLEAVAFRNGREIGRRILRTASKPARLSLRPERVGRLGGQALAFVSVDVLDAGGNHVPDADVPLDLRVSGPARLVGFGSAGPEASGSLQSGTGRSWHGKALAILRSTGMGGAVRLEARSSGLVGGAAGFSFT